MNNVYIVDDDDSVRDSLTMLFKSEELNTEQFSSPIDFLGSINQLSEGVIILDLCMPAMSGMEVMEDLNRQGINLPVICITGHGDVQTAVKALKMGVSDFLEKPFDSSELVTRTKLCIKESENQKQKENKSIRAKQLVANLTPREKEVMQGLIEGLRNKQIAFNMSISIRTVELHRAHILEKLGAKSLADVVKLAIAANFDNDVI